MAGDLYRGGRQGDPSAGLSAIAAASSALKVEEGYRREPYPDAGNTLAVGYGHNLHRRGLSMRQADWLLRDVLQELYERLYAHPVFRACSPARQGVLLEMAYQMGYEGLLSFVQMWDCIRKKHWRKAVDAMLDSKWAQMDSPARAKRVAARFLKG